jgi:hypothetical protein
VLVPRLVPLVPTLLGCGDAGDSVSTFAEGFRVRIHRCRGRSTPPIRPSNEAWFSYQMRERLEMGNGSAESRHSRSRNRSKACKSMERQAEPAPTNSKSNAICPVLCWGRCEIQISKMMVIPICRSCERQELRLDTPHCGFLRNLSARQNI